MSCCVVQPIQEVCTSVLLSELLLHRIQNYNKMQNPWMYYNIELQRYNNHNTHNPPCRLTDWQPTGSSWPCWGALCWVEMLPGTCFSFFWLPPVWPCLNVVCLVVKNPAKNNTTHKHKHKLHPLVKLTAIWSEMLFECCLCLERAVPQCSTSVQQPCAS